MSLDPRKIALSGIGSSVLAIALSGFVVETAPPPPAPAPIVQPSEGGGGKHRHRAAAGREQEQEQERQRRLRMDDEAIILAIAAFVTGESSG